MAEQRPIVYFQRLMGNYDRQVAEIMKAKREYLVFADEASDEVAPVIEREPVLVEVLTPKPVPTQLKPKPIVELNAPLEEEELMAEIATVPEPTPVDEAVEQNVVQEKTTVVEPIVMTPKSTTVQDAKTTEERKDASVEATSTSLSEPVVNVPEKKVEKETPKPKPMTGLGLNLDSIFNEEFSAEQTGYFGK